MDLSDGYIDVPSGKVAVIVTSLEMLGAPPVRPDPPTAGWQLASMPKPDLDWFREVFRRVGTDWLWFSRLVLSDPELRAVIHDPAVEVYALVQDGRDMGLLELDFREPGACELSFFGVVPSAVGTGAGRWLMNRAQEIAWARPIRRFWLHTCTADHPGALGFYLRSGFRAFRRQIEIADDPRLTGHLPRSAAPLTPLLRPEVVR